MEVVRGTWSGTQRVSVICSEHFRKDILYPSFRTHFGRFEGEGKQEVQLLLCEYLCNGHGLTCCPHFAHVKTDAVIMRKYSSEFRGMKSHVQSMENLGLFIIYDSGGMGVSISYLFP